MPDDKLPSINDWDDSKELPSVEDFLKEEVEEELPSVENYIEEEEVTEEDTISIEDANGDPFLEVTDVVKAPEWSELIRMVNDVRESIPDIPEVKYYDEELKQLTEHIEQVKENIPEVKYYDSEVDSICEQIDLLRKSVKDLPEVKYYDEQIDGIEDKIDLIQQEVTNLPEPKYYEDDFVLIREEIQRVREEVVPDFTWIGEAFKKHGIDINSVNDKVDSFNTKINSDIDALSESVDIKDFENRVEIKEVKNNLEKVKNDISKELKECSLKIWDHHHQFQDDDRKLKKSILSKLNEAKQNIEKKINESNNEYYESNKELKSYFEGLKEEIANLPEVKYYDDSIDTIEKNVSSLSSKFESEYETTSYNISELSKLVDVIKVNQKKLKEQQQTFDETDYATIKDLEENYKLFVNKVQQQLSSIGGGGETKLQFLDDIVGIATDLDTYNGKFLKIDTSQPAGKNFIFETVTGATGVGGTWASTDVGIHTLRNVGIATTAKSDFALFVKGNGKITGDWSVTGVGTVGILSATDAVVSGAATVVGALTVGGDLNVTGDLSYDEVTGRNINVTGISTFGSSSGVGTVHVGVGTTALLVDGDARITGILTVGRSSITLDGDNNQINVGLVTVSNSTIVIGENVTLDASATGINSAPNVLYVAKDGNDSNNGTSIDNAFLTIKAAVGIATSETTIKVLSGNYVENNPITLPAFCAVVGDDLRTVKVLPNNATSDLFHVNKGTKLANMTFSGHLAPAAAVAFPTAGATNVGGGKWKGPYVQNCTSDTTTGTGIRIDGDLAVKTKSMNVDAFTQYNQGGVGVAVTNEGYAQLVSVFTICCDQAITAHKGGQADVANSNCSFGTLGLVADGIGSQQFIGTVTTEAEAAQDNIIVDIGAEDTRPYDGQVVFFDRLYQSVETITVGTGGTGYTSTPSVTIDAPAGPNGETATAFATLEGDSVTSITIINNGSQYESTPDIVISGPDVGVNTATATIGMNPTYYTINSSTPVSSGITTLTLAENLINTVGVGSTAFFFQQSKIVASSHTFEYIGSGNTITVATPKRGGVTIQANEVVTTNGGNVVYTSTDQSGNFRIGDELQINQTTGTISGRSFSKSLFSEMTPFILALS